MPAERVLAELVSGVLAELVFAVLVSPCRPVADRW
jgi:hypothetical protein